MVSYLINGALVESSKPLSCGETVGSVLSAKVLLSVFVEAFLPRTSMLSPCCHELGLRLGLPEPLLHLSHGLGMRRAVHLVLAATQSRSLLRAS